MATRKAGRKAATKAAATNEGTVSKPTRRRLALVDRPKPRAADARMPGEQHPGHTGMTGRMHEQLGSQIERERHDYGGSTTPKSGAGRTNKRAVAKARGRRK
jgi:hypothetical protein